MFNQQHYISCSSLSDIHRTKQIWTTTAKKKTNKKWAQFDSINKKNKITIFLCLIFFISFPGIEMCFAFISWWVITWRYQPPLVSKPSHPIRMLCSIQMNTNQWIEKMKLKPVLEKRSYKHIYKKRENGVISTSYSLFFVHKKRSLCTHHTLFKAKKNCFQAQIFLLSKMTWFTVRMVRLQNRIERKSKRF